MKILFLIESFRAGGKERRLSSLIKNLVLRDDIKLEIILFRDEIHYDIPKSKNLKIQIVKKHFKKDLLLIFKICKIAADFKPDVVNPWGVVPAFYSIFIKFFCKIPLLNNQITDSPINVNFGIHSLTLFFSDLVISNSKSGIITYNVFPKKSLVIYNGFNFNRLNTLIDPDILKKKYNLSNNIIVGMVASFSIFKDYTTYLKSAELVLSKNKNVKFLCVGDGDKTSYIKSIKGEFINNIIFIDTQKDIESLINIFDIGVLSTYTEGISNSIMEYMALSKPVVATIGGGTCELVENLKSGFLVKSEDPIMMHNCIENLIKDSSLRLQMGNYGNEIIKYKFNYLKMCSTFYETFKCYSTKNSKFKLKNI